MLTLIGKLAYRQKGIRNKDDTLREWLRETCFLWLRNGLNRLVLKHNQWQMITENIT